MLSGIFKEGSFSSSAMNEFQVLVLQCCCFYDTLRIENFEVSPIKVVNACTTHRIQIMKAEEESALKRR
jgi:hypothetical protein